MTEEKIIDGVNVVNCGYFCETDTECSICGMGTSGEDTFCRDCEDNPNCYYKQLKRLEQARDKLKKKLGTKEIQLANAEFDLHFEEMKTRELKQENEELIEDNLNLSKENKQMKSALEEIREVLTDEYYIDTVNAIHKIDEVLKNENRES